MLTDQRTSGILRSCLSSPIVCGQRHISITILIISQKSPDLHEHLFKRTLDSQRQKEKRIAMQCLATRSGGGHQKS